MKLKRLTALLLSVMMVLSLAACGGGGDTKDDSASGDLSGKTIIIGNITPVTGAQAAYGLAITNSIQLAIDEINAAGGILGATVKLSTKDDQGTPAEAVSGFNSLLSEGASAIIGATLSSCTSAITSLADDEGIVLVTPSSTADSITTKDDYVFRSCFKDSFQGEIVAAYAKDQGWTKAAVLYATGDTYSSGLHDSFVKAAEKYGIEIVCEQSSSDTGAVDFSSQLATIAASGADMLFAPYYYDAVGPKIIPQAREAGFKGAIMGCDGFDGTQDYTTGDVCKICASQKRDRSIICVVEGPRDIKSIERTHEYNGLYHVLHGLISPMDGIGADQLCIKELLARLNDTVKEVIMATSPTVEGEATAMYIAKLIKPLGIKTTRLAYGLPVGSSLEYADETTLYRAMAGRGEM